MAITRAQQVRQMYKEGSMEPVKQAGVMNYMPSEMVTVPKIAKSSPDTPTAKLAYITPEEQDILIDLNLYGSLDGKPNRGPGGIPSLEGDFGSPTGSTYSGGSAGEDGGSFTGGGGGGDGPELPPAVKAAVAQGKPTSVVTKEDEKRARDEVQKFLKETGQKSPSFLENLVTSRRKGAYNLATMIPGSKERITKMRKAYAEYLKSMGITPTDELEDTDNLYDFFNKQAFEKGKTTFTDPTELNQKIYDKLAEDMGPFSNDPLRNQFETLTQEEFMAQNPDLFSKGQEMDVQSYGDFIAEKFGAPSVKYSGNVGNLEMFVEERDPITGKPTKYGYKEKTGDGGGDGGMSDYERRLLELENQLKNQQAAAPTTTQNPFAFRFLADGGRAQAMDGGIMNADMIGGIMDGSMDEMGRQMYGLGKLVKKATRGIKKIAKSPLGKVALLAGLNFAPTLFGKQTVLQGLGGMFKSEGLKKFFLKDAAEKFSLGNLSQKGLMTGIGALSALPLIFQGDDEEEFDPYRGPDIDIAAIRGDPYGAMRGAYRLAADGGLMRTGYQEGGDAEPVAKKTMPLIDMDGKEKDYRETGGFVDMGRMERADDVPARLSKNEFVFTADAVRNAGEGDIDKGAEVMYNMMKNLEAGGEVSEESQGLEGARKMFQTSQRLGEVI